MNYDWYKIINQVEFAALDLVSREVEVVLEGIGLKTILVTRGNVYSITYEGVMLSPGLNGENPFAFGGFAAYIDASFDIWLGIPSA